MRNVDNGREPAGLMKFQKEVKTSLGPFCAILD